MMLAVQPQWAMFVLKTCEIIQSHLDPVTLILPHLKFLNLSLQNILNLDLNTETLLESIKALEQTLCVVMFNPNCVI